MLFSAAEWVQTVLNANRNPGELCVTVCEEILFFLYSGFQCMKRPVQQRQFDSLTKPACGESGPVQAQGLLLSGTEPAEIKTVQNRPWKASLEQPVIKMA